MLLVILDVKGSLAKYKTTESIKLVEGTINYKLADFNLVSMYQENENGEYESSDIVPMQGYSLNYTESYCEINGVTDDSISFEYEDGLLNFLG